MDSVRVGLIVGGFVPAVIYALSGVLQKSAAQSGVGVGPYLTLLGLGVSLVGLVAWLALPSGQISAPGLGWSSLVGVVWGLGTGAVLWALSSTGVPIAKLVPLYNMNTLVAVVLGLWLYAEAREVHIPTLVAGAALIAVGSILVSRS